MNSRVKILGLGLPLASGVTAFVYFHDHRLHETIGVAALSFGFVLAGAWWDVIEAKVEALPRPIRTALQIAGFLLVTAAIAELSGGVSWPVGVITVGVLAAGLWCFDMALMIRANRRRQDDLKDRV
jgi:hypothetical protein